MRFILPEGWVEDDCRGRYYETWPLVGTVTALHCISHTIKGPLREVYRQGISY